jgi:hypothetical protein
LGELQSSQKSTIEKKPNHGSLPGRNFAGAKAQLSFQPFAARLKSGPDYKATSF